MSGLFRIAAIGCVLLLAGCGGAVEGVDRADKAALQVDAVGCPDLSGAYAFNVPGERGVSYQGSMLLEFPSRTAMVPGGADLRPDRAAHGARSLRLAFSGRRGAGHAAARRDPRVRDRLSRVVSLAERSRTCDIHRAQR